MRLCGRSDAGPPKVGFPVSMYIYESPKISDFGNFQFEVMTATVLDLFPRWPDDSADVDIPVESHKQVQRTSLASEYLVAADLCLMGYLVSMSCENSPYDLVVDTVGENRVLTRNRTG